MGTIAYLLIGGILGFLGIANLGLFLVAIIALISLLLLGVEGTAWIALGALFGHLIAQGF